MLPQPTPIWLMSVTNPEPERALASLSLVAHSAPFVLAMSVETDTPPEPAP
jgi:hypothetical protein